MRGAATAAANAPASGSPWYSAPNGRRATNVDPSDAGTGQRPVR